MAMEDNFYEAKREGKRGEAIVVNALRARGHEITDLTDNAEARFNDVDFLLTRNGITVSMEVKNELKSEITDNVFLEIFNTHNFSHNCYGWFKFSTADFICFLQENRRRALIVDLEELRAYTRKNKYPCARTSNSEGIVFPIEALRKLDSYYEMEV